jgi:lysophospholipase L1-like esterase
MGRTMIATMIAVCLVALLCAAAMGDEKPAGPKHNLVTFFNKCRAGGEVTVAYIGGSITAQEGWRPFTTKWLQEQFKGLKIKEVNAAIGGTGSWLGAFRLQKHVLQYDPDALFVEFAVNDNGAPDDEVKATMEGIVRQAWSRPKKPDIMFTFTTAGNLDVPTARHQAVADAYGIPTCDFQASVRALCVPGLVDWDIMAADRVHPGDWGHAVYAATLATHLRRQMNLKEAAPPPDVLPPATFSDEYTTARLMPVTVNVPEGWQKLDKGWCFDDGSLMATKPGQTIEFKFNATMVAIFYELRMDGGIVAAEVDGKPAGEPLDVSCGPTYRFNRLNSLLVAKGLPKGLHTLKLTVLDKKHELSNGHEFHLGYLMLAG